MIRRYLTIDEHVRLIEASDGNAGRAVLTSFGPDGVWLKDDPSNAWAFALLDVCATCNGTGQIREPIDVLGVVHGSTWTPCPDCAPVYSDGAVCATCGGTGRSTWLDCPSCGGSGVAS